MRALQSALAGIAFAVPATVATASHAEQAGLYFGFDVGLYDFELPGELAALQGCDDQGCSDIASPSYEDDSFRVGGVVGLGITEMVRAEAEVFFDIETASGSETQEQGLTASVSGDVRTYGVMLNSWVDIGAGSAWGVYVGGGAGLLFAETSHMIVDRAENALLGSSEDTDTEFAYQIGLGINFQGWHAGYRFLQTDDLNDYGEVTQHILVVGLRMW